MSTSEESSGSDPTQVIEIIDSSGESDTETSSHKKNDASSRLDIDESTNASDTMESGTRSLTDVTKKIHNRRKSVHHSIKTTEDISFESEFIAAKDLESASCSTEGSRKRRSENNINDAIDCNLDDPEMSQMLRKIAYCRVFTNYLLRQYDMLAIDFKLYSNVDLLMLELKKRVDTYTSIRRSRQLLHANQDDHAGN